MLTFADLQLEVARRGTKNDSGSQFADAIKTSINTSLFRIARECAWRQLRRQSYITTVTSYSTGTVSATENLNTITGSSTSWITTGAITIGRKISIEGSNKIYTIRSISSDTAITLSESYDGTTDTNLTYEIFPQQEYILPIQSTHRMFLTHMAYGYPYKLNFVTDQEFFDSGAEDITTGVPYCYRMWGETMAINQPRSASVMRISSSSSSDTGIGVTIFGTVSGYPDYEVLTSNGTTAVSGTKTFTFIERISKNNSSVGRITVDANTALTTIAVIPTGDITAGIVYPKIQLYPLPIEVYPIDVYFYKDPYRLVNDGDINELGHDFDECIILLATSKIKYESDQKEGEYFYSMFQDELRSLKRKYLDKPDYLASLKRPNESRRNMNMLNKIVGYNQLGGNYGPNTY